ncbi:MAG: hypothetical protein ABJF89_05805 [Parasphingorhabdus sp.]|uniref:hypothetical protein n=1 Tax=Parasphingorhabdus sp. TaxID=2709688 RepID=UPI003264A639
MTGLVIQIDERRTIDTAKTAMLLLKSRAIRTEYFRDRKPEIDDVAWNILMDLIASKETEEPVTSHDMAVTHNVAIGTMIRYVTFLIDIDLITKNKDAAVTERMSLALTETGDTLTSNALRIIGRELANF